MLISSPIGRKQEESDGRHGAFTIQVLGLTQGFLLTWVFLNTILVKYLPHMMLVYSRTCILLITRIRLFRAPPPRSLSVKIINPHLEGQEDLEHVLITPHKPHSNPSYPHHLPVTILFGSEVAGPGHGKSAANPLT